MGDLVVAPRRTLRYAPTAAPQQGGKAAPAPPAKDYKPGEKVPFSEADIKVGLPKRLKASGVLVDSSETAAPAPGKQGERGAPAAFLNQQPGAYPVKGPQVIRR